MPEKVDSHRLNVRELEKSEKDMLLLGVLASIQFDKEETGKGKKRKHEFCRYSFEGERICAGAFRFIYDLSDFHLKQLRKHMKENGPAVPRVHGNRGRRPHNALTFLEIEMCVSFIKGHAEEFGLPFPAPLHGRDGHPPIFLPVSQTYKSVHAEYVRSCALANMRKAGISVFRSIWKACLPHIKFMTPRTDVCFKCERHRQEVQSAVGEEEKTTALAEFTRHLQSAQAERQFYRTATEKAHEELEDHHHPIGPPFPPCAQSLKAMHYTFDYAQQVTLPHLARQPGPLYFKTPRKVQLFGVCDEGIPRQVNYLIDEADTIGPNGTKSHGANSVISLLHHFFSVHGHGEEECILHADNCAGQNKNRTIVNYLAWRVAVGLHKKITLAFMIAGHTRCLVDGCFGLVKRAYRRANIYTLGQLAEVVAASAACNVAEDGSAVNWYAWDDFFDQSFGKVKGISKMHHFIFHSEKPGIVSVRVAIDSELQEVKILKVPLESLSPSVMPEMLSRGGITEERQRYLYKEIREFAPPPYRDDLCPPP